jgi:hypothetical protein
MSFGKGARRALLALVVALLLSPQLAVAQTAPPGGSAAAADAAPLTAAQEAAIEEAVIKASQNPVGNIAIIPFQNNFNYGAGPYSRLQYNLNLQPVVPIELSTKWNLIARTIIPVLDNPSSAPPALCASALGCGTTFGIGDLNPQFYFAPKTRPGGIIWGAGPQFQFPTAAPGALGAGKYSVGPTAVGLLMPGPWVLGVLVNGLWSVGGDPTRTSVGTMVIQPFINYNLKGGYAITTAPLMSDAWTSTSQNGKWLVPLGGGMSKTFKLGPDPMQLGLYYYANVARPTYAPSGQIKFTWSLLFPIKRGQALPN